MMMAYLLPFVEVFAVVILSSFVSRSTAKCGGKTILKSLQGSIDTGPNKYPANTQCEWLIEAPQPNMTITLKFFDGYETECTYDYLFVYDGPSYMSKLLGSFSGNNIPDPVVALSGKMLINFYSDTNYVLKGFKANYTIENCSSQCSGHGSCSNGQCTCDLQWRGKYCNVRLCPDNCEVASSHGTCDMVNKHCTCRTGFAGESCSLSLNTNDGSNTWYKMVTYSSEFTPRLGHAAVYHQKTDTIWSFGGFDLNSADDNLFKFNMSTGQWIKVTTVNPRPVGRYSHTASLYNDEIFIFGGQINDKNITNEFWKFNINTMMWTLISSANTPPAITMHTANVVDDKLYIFGGQTMNRSFTSSMYKYDLSSANTGWTRVKWKSGKEQKYRLKGHSAVYDNTTRSIIVFGGYSLFSAKKSNRMNKFHVFHVDLLVWSEWLIEGSVPKSRSFHSATLVGAYIVLFGGSVHTHTSDETCYDNELHFFHLKCHKWVSLTALSQLSPGSIVNKPRIGRYSHAAVARDSTLMIIGGYSGTPRGDMHAYKLPSTVAMVNVTSYIPGLLCGGYKTGQTCQADPNCGWCKTACYAVKDVSKCSSFDWKVSSCPGACGVHGTCTACLTWGFKPTPNCGWCVQDSRCYPVLTPQGACETLDSQNAWKLRGWWGAQGRFLSGNVDQCRQHDYPPGLIQIFSANTPNSKYPDDVHHVLSTQDIKMSYDTNLLKMNKTSIGFVYPFKYATTPYSPSCVLLNHINTGIGTKSSLNVSQDETKSKEMSVSSCEGSSSILDQMSCRATGDYFPNPEKDKKYYIKHVGERTIESSYEKEVIFNVKWNKVSASLFWPLNSPYLEPYSSEGAECGTKDTCLACMTDASCGWCDLTNQCLARKLSSETVCTDGQHTQLYVMNSTECSRCSDFKDCTSCLQQKFCEWVNHQHMFVCVRKDFYKNTQMQSSVITDLASCKSDCEKRITCSSCISNNIGCAWCENTQSCFLFGTYISRYPYGECTRWVDVNSGGQCKDCNRHTTCKSCLADVQCGWCGSTDNPLRGGCFDGDFGGPIGGQCSSLANLNESVAWSYGRCPDVDECRLGLHKCHYNATCHNVYDSYNCICNRGFTGDGKVFCNKTCDPPCIHGDCMEDYRCKCYLGWKGINCSIDCGCNGHSTCNKDIGICDKCQDYTHGNHCELCVPGSYGNATTKQGCKKCQCNGHGDVKKGECDRKSGVCFCNDNTMGDSCEKCLPGLVGDPTNGQRCYYECSTRNILTNVTQGDISTKKGSGVAVPSNTSCLWVISSSTNSSHNIIYNKNPPKLSVSPVTLQFTSIKLSCSTEHVDIYDGLPYFILNNVPPYPPPFYRLGSFCGSMDTVQKHITAVTGNMVVVFHGNISSSPPSKGFEAVFKINRCKDSCHGNRYCISTSTGESCVCKQGWFGPDCDLKTCPNNCTSGSGQGICEMKTCQCSAGFTGSDCSKLITKGKGAWQLIFTVSFPNNSVNELPRLGHSMIVHSNSLWIYGGYSLPYGIVNTVYRYDVISKTMSRVTGNQLPQSLPQGRYLHCAFIHQDSMFVYGGVTKDGVSDQMWYLDTQSTKWYQVTFNSDAINLKLAGHSCTNVGNIITIIGGYNPTGGFNGKIYQYSITNKAWSTMEPLETGTNPTGLYGHTAVYHHNTQTVFVFGGYQFKSHEVKPSAELYSLHLPSRQWKLLQPPSNFKLLPKVFHVSSIVGDIMIVYGGRTSFDEQASSELLAYKINCNSWHTLNKQDSAILGSSPGYTVSAAISSNNSGIYIFGGFNGQAISTLHKLSLPTDLCQGVRDKNTCIGTLGCSWCEVHYSNNSASQSSVQATACYMVTSSPPTICHAKSNVTQTVFVNGSDCKVAAAIEQRNCNTYSTCSACLSSYPNTQSGSLKCHWCMQCSGGGKCVEKSVDCDKTDSCAISPSKRTSPGTCPENTCEASSCKGCVADSRCMWTPQLKWLSETQQESSSNGVAYPWNCFHQSAKDKHPNINIVYVKNDECLKSCTRHSDCHSCLQDAGGDGGWKSCVWSESLGQCFSPSYLPMVELAGFGGRIVKGSPKQCMASCVLKKQCSLCFKSYNCGWCSKQNSNGEGVCMEGGLHGPLYGTCQGNTIDSGPRTPPDLSQKITTSQSPVWASVLCPLENECTNGRNNCTSVEDCVDTPESFKCVCKPGYNREGADCKPVCIGGCGNGVCVTPDNCSCNFGWTSRNCSVKCHCNNHGHCLSESKLDTCYNCRNNTKGERCELCSPLFVGNATNNGSCRSCFEVCNKSAYVCMSLADRIQAHNNSLSLEYNEVAKWLPHGPVEITHDQECLCKNNSQGVRCQNCIKGHFFLKSFCQPCQCNGHGDSCKDTNGVCKCFNNTQSDCTTSEPCYSRQCVKCAEGYLGRPYLNRQCYSKVIHMNEFAISSKAGSDVNGENKAPPLPKGTTVSYVVYPKYTNVDIRTTIDIFQGGLDVYLSTNDRTFAVYVNKTTGEHSVGIMRPARRRRAVDNAIPLSEVKSVYGGKDRLNTFVTMHSTDDIIHIRAIENRLVLTFPYSNHYLRSSRFYLLLMGVGDKRHDDTTGIIYFRQDLSQIDLFVFFSVFFSVFFLVLALCIIAWKLKQFHDRRRIAQVQSRELETMASRPYATYSFLTDMKTAPQSCWRIKRENSRRHLRERKGHLYLREASHRPVILPCAHQTTEDTRAAVVSVMFQLPSNENSDFQLAFGSVIVTSTGQHSIGSLFGYPLLSGGKTRNAVSITS